MNEIILVGTNNNTQKSFEEELQKFALEYDLTIEQARSVVVGAMQQDIKESLQCSF